MDKLSALSIEELMNFKKETPSQRKSRRIKRQIQELETENERMRRELEMMRQRVRTTDDCNRCLREQIEHFKSFVNTILTNGTLQFNTNHADKIGLVTEERE